jgi:hypothetical protein
MSLLIYPHIKSQIIWRVHAPIAPVVYAGPNMPLKAAHLLVEQRPEQIIQPSHQGIGRADIDEQPHILRPAVTLDHAYHIAFLKQLRIFAV